MTHLHARRGGIALTCIGLALLASVAPTAEARATTITVTTTVDEVAITGNCSLREAVIAANTDAAVDACAAGAGADTIAIPLGRTCCPLPAPTTTRPQPAISILPVMSSSAAPAPTRPRWRVSDLTASSMSDRPPRASPSSCRRMTIVNGGGVTHGAGVRNHAAMTLRDCRLQGNITVSSSLARGGGLYSDATAVVENCTIVDNQALGGVFGRGGGVCQQRHDGDQRYDRARQSGPLDRHWLWYRTRGRGRRRHTKHGWAHPPRRHGRRQRCAPGANGSLG